jgi:uncharacterized protein
VSGGANLVACGRSPCGCVPAPTSKPSCWASPPANASGGLDADLRRRLSGVRLRLAGGTKHATWQGPFEIVALTGTLSQDGGHLHLAVADQQGRTIGGHLAEGCTVRTTAEVVVAADDRLLFAREHDPATGYDELVVRERDP